MSSFTIAGDPPIDVILRKSARAKRISLRVSRLDGRVTLTIPKFSAERDAVEFANEKAQWLRTQVGRRPVAKTMDIGGSVMFDGVDIPIVAGPLRTAKVIDGQMVVPDDPPRVAARIAAYMKTMARNRLRDASDHYATRIGQKYAKITIRDTRSRWGSCSSQGHLMYSWRLIMAPPKVLNYVAAHEVAHLVEMNHSSAFWRIVERLDPAFKRNRTWLRENGEHLHVYQFKT